ncbi:MAG: pyruvate carboxylase subunit B [Kiritimatiellae bacterium]|nr:pyruvate carboxylase subunit B [Kiritimatiellia bacterium]
MATKKKTDKTVSARPRIRVTDTSLRDAHQSLWATRMRTGDILPIIEALDRAGFYSLECWGGATFDVCLRFLRENPWERLRLIKSRCKTPLQMLLRGQNILGYRNYPDDVLRRFIELAALNGIEIFRIFDALNDTRNLELAVRTVKAVGAHAQGTISYTFSPVHTVEAYVKLARDLEALGADSICIKDMAGILSPAAAERLVAALTANIKIPVQLHAHMTSGMAVAAYLEGVRAGAGALDCAVAAMSGCASQPPVQTLQACLSDAGYETGLDLEAVHTVNEYFRKLKPLREPDHGALEFVDVNVLEHHIPGGMISNLRSQLQQQGALDRLDEVLAELPRVRADMGYPPLVTPTSQIVGVQAVLNVISGERYSMVPQETRDYVKGLYGRSPAPIAPKLVKQILGAEKPVTGRPADLLGTGLPAAARELDPKLTQNEEDLVTYCIFPEVALGYFKWRALPEGQRPPVPADQETEAAQAKRAAPVMPPPAAAAPDAATAHYAAVGRLVAQLFKQMGAALPEGTALPAVEPQAPAPEERQAEAPKAAPATQPLPAGDTINAPLNGTFYRTPGPGKPNFADEGAVVKTGQTVCVVEAMKLFNQIKAHKNCRVLKFVADDGTHVNKGQPLAVIAPV